MPPLFLSVILNARPVDVRYTSHAVRDIEDVAVGSLSTIEPMDESYSRQGSTVICYSK